MRIVRWPERPGLPGAGEPVLVRVAVPLARQDARCELRSVLRSVLAEWSGLRQEHLPIEETGHGPAWVGALAGAPLDVSLSYSEEEAWVGLIRGARIGVDGMRVRHVPGAYDVARLYLGPAAVAAMRNAAEPDRAFAQAWTAREAGLKCMKRGLVEWDGTDVPAAVTSTSDGSDWIVAVAVAPGDAASLLLRTGKIGQNH